MTIYLKHSSIFVSFISHLKLRGVSLNTLKNYRSDLKFFAIWVSQKLGTTGIKTESLDEALPFLSTDLASEFKVHLKELSPSENTINRRLSALRTLSHFLVESQILESDFMEGIANIGSQSKNISDNYPSLAHFKRHLEEANVSPNTVKNYVSDVKHFLDWLESH